MDSRGTTRILKGDQPYDDGPEKTDIAWALAKADGFCYLGRSYTREEFGALMNDVMGPEPRMRPTVVVEAPQHVEAASPLLKLIVIGVIIFGAMIAGMGVLLVYLGSTGVTKINFFGQSFDSANVGIAAIFLGATTVVVVITRLLKRIKELAALPKNW